jgi:hypothetical protein
MSKDVETMTVGEFILECEMFPSSRENYDLMKETCEIGLFESFVESMRFIERNSGEVNNARTVLTESFFIESSDTKIEYFEERLAERIAAWAGKAKVLFLRLCKFLSGILYKLIEKAKDTPGKIQTIIKYANTGKISDADKKAIGIAIANAVKQFNIPFADGANRIPPGRFLITNDSSLRSKAAAVMLNNSVYLKAAAPYENALSLQQAISIFDRFPDALRNPKRLESINNDLDRYKSDNAARGFEIPNDSKKLEDARGKLDKFAKEIESAVANAEKGEGAQNVQAIFTKLSVAIGNTSKLLIALGGYRDRIAHEIVQIIGPSMPRKTIRKGEEIGRRGRSGEAEEENPG